MIAVSDFTLQVGNVRFAPSVHGRVTWAEEVRRRFAEWRPDVVAVELPASLRALILEGVMRLPVVTAVCFRERRAPDARLCYVPIDPCDAMIEAVRLALEHGVPIAFVDADVTDYREEPVALPCDYVADRAGGHAYCERVWDFLRGREKSEDDVWREAFMAARLSALATERERVLWVGGFSHWPALAEALRAGPRPRKTPEASDVSRVAPPPEDALLAAVKPRSLWQTLVEMPYVAFLYECAREGEQIDGPSGFPKLEAVRTIFLEAEKAYRESTKETVNVTQWRALMQYARNLTLLSGRYRPTLYETVVAARNTVDGDFAAETYDIAVSYPYQRLPDDLPQLGVHGDRARLGDERFLAKPRWPQRPGKISRIRLRRRPPKRHLEFWKALWHLTPRFGICSWPPEDERQERFMDFVRKRALQVVTDDRSHVEEFASSFKNGLDLRETLRNWHTGKLYVRETPPPLGQVGPVVVIFRDEPTEFEGGWRETLYAEHNNESDIAFYADALGEHVVGPGICYTHFNGIMSVFPACHIRDPWTDPVVGEYPTCSETLLAAAILYSHLRYIAYVAARPPDPHLRALASANRRHIIYLPIQMFSRKALTGVRKFHILDGHHVRRYAAEFPDP